MLLRLPSGLKNCFFSIIFVIQLKNQVYSPQVKICFKAPPWASLLSGVSKNSFKQILDAAKKKPTKQTAFKEAHQIPSRKPGCQTPGDKQ